MARHAFGAATRTGLLLLFVAQSPSTPGLLSLLGTPCLAQNAAPAASPPTKSSTALMKQAEALEKAGKYQQAGDTYDKAAKAFEAAGKHAEQADALEKSAAMYEKWADQLANAAKGGAPAAKPEVKPEAATPPAAPAAPKRASQTTANPAPAAPVKTVHLPPLTPKPGYIIGRAVKEDGSPLPQFKVYYYGFEKGKFILTTEHFGEAPNVNGVADGNRGQFAAKVPDGLYNSSAGFEMTYHGKNYKLPLFPEPRKYDFPGTHLQYLNGGLVHNYVWKISGLRGFDAGQPTAVDWYGGLIHVDCFTVIGGYGYKELVFAEPKGSRVEITLVPQEPLMDGSQGKTLTKSFELTLGDYIKDVPVGYYKATARVIEPDGTVKPLKLSLTPTTYDANIRKATIAWQDEVPIIFPPSDIDSSVTNPMGIGQVNLYLGEHDAVGVSP